MKTQSFSPTRASDSNPVVKALHIALSILGSFALVVCLQSAASAAVQEPRASLPLQLTWGHHSEANPFYLKITAEELTMSGLRLEQAEANDQVEALAIRAHSGGGDVDGLKCTLEFAPKAIQAITNVQQIWRHLVRHTDPGAAERLQADPGWRPDPRKLTFQLDREATRGFSLTVDQLLTQKTIWLPAFDLFITAGERPVSFNEHLEALSAKGGQRVLDKVSQDPDATYAQFTARWEDMGHPNYANPHSVPPGHIVGLTWDSALHKFGVDRFAEVRNDYGKADVFHFRFAIGDAAKSWRAQTLPDGLPIITTQFEREGLGLAIEQFAFPLLGPPTERRGDIPMVLLQKVTVRELEGRARTASLQMELDREVAGSVALRERDGAFLLAGDSGAWLSIQGTGLRVKAETHDKRRAVAVDFDLEAKGTREFVVKLPSPIVPSAQENTLLALGYAECRADTVGFWEDYLARGASFKVPEPAVNSLFRANLWHALRLPRRHGGSGPDVKMDLPYSNFAYDQKGTPWPVNQAVYVDYMLYDLRGYHAVSAEELAAIYRNNQEPNGHVGGYANWGVYTPSMIYSVAQHFLLSGDRVSFGKLLPQTLRALDWCLGEVRRASDPNNPAPGLMLAPLNDLTHDARSWAFNQAYFVAGFDFLGRALTEIGHPRAEECRQAALTMRAAVEREFARASVGSPAVQLADGTWSVYVPTDAQASGRLFQVWYPTDVDVGPLHLLRLRAMDPSGSLATAMLNDHEDNLFIHQWGTINEPVYNMQGTAYLLRDEPKAAIRTFYSTMACSFSHTVFEPVEHRWAWGQYFGPPSTDGSWFELFRNMLVREVDDDSLLLCQAAPRPWLEEGKRIEVRQAPTYFGPVNFTITGGRDSITAKVDLGARRRPGSLLVRFRHPENRPIRSVQVNGENWTDFDRAEEWVRIANPTQASYTITTRHEL
ncbi:MAG: hypothetical protein AB9869_00740 [Verrucomicrobiia bacterium]